MYIKKNPFTYSCLCAGESIHHHHGRGDAKPSNIPHTGGHPQAQVCFKWLWILFIIMETWSFPYWDCILYRYIKEFHACHKCIQNNMMNLVYNQWNQKKLMPAYIFVVFCFCFLFCIFTVHTMYLQKSDITKYY